MEDRRVKESLFQGRFGSHSQVHQLPMNGIACLSLSLRYVTSYIVIRRTTKRRFSIIGPFWSKHFQQRNTRRPPTDIILFKGSVFHFSSTIM